MLREQKLKFAVMPLHGPDDDSFQNLKLNYVERTKIIICSNAVIWANKVIGSVKRRFEDDSHEDIVQAAYKVLNSWRVIEEIPKENMRRSGCETEHFEKNSDNGNKEQSGNDDDEQSDDNDCEHCYNDNKNDLN